MIHDDTIDDHGSEAFEMEIREIHKIGIFTTTLSVRCNLYDPTTQPFPSDLRVLVAIAWVLDEPHDSQETYHEATGNPSKRSKKRFNG